MSRLVLPRRIGAVVVPALAITILSAAARAADPTKYLPDGTMLVMTLNVRQLVQTPLVRGDEKAFKQATSEMAKALAGFGVDPAKDVDRVVLAVGEQLKAVNIVILLEGRFNVDKVQGRLRELARDRKNDMQAIEESGAVYFEGRLPKPGVPDPKVTLPERFALTVLDGSTIAVAADRAALA